MLTGTRSPIRPFEGGRRRGRGGGEKKPRRTGRLILLIVSAILLVLLAAAVYYVSTPYKPSAEAEAAMKSDQSVAVSQTDDWIEFEPLAASGAANAAKQPGVIFYPGGRVKPEAYAVFARDLAETGRHVFVIKMPFNFAFLGQNEAENVYKKYPDESFVLGGHSLGGPFAARFAAAHPDQVAGIFFLASYAESKGDLSRAKIPALSITASNDKVLNKDSYEKGRAYLPKDARYEVIEGGNHGQFGSYGQQGKDGKATLSGAEQRKQTVSLISAWLDAFPAASGK
ncbi:alpha/beta hydrolase [Saccharibacillus sp. O23]|uniref:alpha/beta fold hydrolase n=1 Tax=Saccharibacillus sp. O23 TaxID=2009338 RepID=UPI000B4E21F1|nr:alpha/beta fold hydrolase [Saccharibacillus sp. O23]OWR29369.1 alpha/beta hydrolase [Saccharibacillus sp. O23]